MNSVNLAVFHKTILNKVSLKQLQEIFHATSRM